MEQSSHLILKLIVSAKCGVFSKQLYNFVLITLY